MPELRFAASWDQRKALSGLVAFTLQLPCTGAPQCEIPPPLRGAKFALLCTNWGKGEERLHYGKQQGMQAMFRSRTHMRQDKLYLF